jgi:hypothetical protein
LIGCTHHRAQPITFVALEKDAIDFRSLSIQSSHPHLRIWRTIYELTVNSSVCAARQLSSAIKTLSHDPLPQRQWLERRGFSGSDSWLFSSTIPPRLDKTSAMSVCRSPGVANRIRSASTSVTLAAISAKSACSPCRRQTAPSPRSRNHLKSTDAVGLRLKRMVKRRHKPISNSEIAHPRPSPLRPKGGIATSLTLQPAEGHLIMSGEYLGR